jgi:hypothetical protein
VLLKTGDYLDSIGLFKSIVREDYFFHGVGVPFDSCDYRFNATSAANILVLEVYGLAFILFDELTRSWHDLQVRASLHVSEPRVFDLIHFVPLVFKLPITFV